MKLDETFGGSLLKAADLQGRAVSVTIEHVEMKAFDDGNKLILNFAGKDRALVCNKTNAFRIAEMHGDETDNWPGKIITLAPERVEFQGKLVDAIRVQLVNSTPAAAAPTPAPIKDNDDIPF